MKKTLFILIFAIAALSVFVSCNNNTEVVTYKVTVMNGEDVYREKDVAVGDIYVLPAKPADSKPFKGWKVGVSTELMQPGEDLKITADTEITAEWITSCTVSFDLGFESQDKITDETVDYGTYATEPQSSLTTDRPGYAFDGWYLNEEKYVFGTTPVTEDITLKAHWTTNYCTVSFDTDGGEALSSFKIPYGETISSIAETPVVPVKTGYTFEKWTLEDGTDFLYDDVIESDTKLKAQWQPNSCTVKFDLCDDSLKKISDETVEYGKAVQQPASSDIPDRPGYVFDGWYFNEEEYVFSSYVTEDMTLKAHWTADYYTVIFNTVGGSSVPSLKIKNGEKINLVSEPKPTREGYVFNGWKNSDGSDFDFTTPITSSITLKADWISESKCATVTLKDSSGYTIRKATVLIGDTYIIPDLGYTIASCTDGDNNKITTESLTINKNTVLTIEKGKYKEYEIGDIGPGGGYIVFDADYKGSNKTYIQEFRPVRMTSGYFSLV